MRRRPPHCASAYHFQRCICNHERQSHDGEEGHCLERKCECESFRLGLMFKEMKHITLR